MDNGDLQSYVDRAAVEAVLVRYVNANGRDDFDAMAECFAEDGGMGNGDPEGRDGLRARFATIRERSLPLWKVDAIHRTQHLLTNIEVQVDGDTASAFSGALTTIVATRDGEEIIVQRGITYTDDLVRTPEGWRIKKRIHDLKWETEGSLVTRHQYS